MYILLPDYASVQITSPTFTGTVTGLTKTTVGLPNVDNTADTAKPVSTAQATAIALKLNLTGGTLSGQLQAASDSATVPQVQVGRPSTATSGTANAAIQFPGPGVDHQFMVSVPGSSAAARRFRFGRSGGNDYSAAVSFISLGGDDKIYFGSAEDTNLYRESSNRLKSDGGLTLSAALYFGTDTNLYRTAADVLKTDDTLLVATKVGVGATTTPSALVHITDATAANMKFEKTGASAGTFTIYNDGAAVIIGPGSSPTRRFGFFDQMGAGAGNSATNPPYTNFNDTNTGIFFPDDSDKIAITTGGTERLRVDNSGNVTIGASLTISTDLTVTGTVSGAGFTANAITTGEETFDRRWCNTATATTGSGTMRVTYFTAKKTETTTQVALASGTTNASGGTLVRIGLYTIDGSGGGTLVASTPSDTNLFIATSTKYTKSWSVSYAKVAGQRYALGVLFVGSTAPTMTGSNLSGAAGTFAADPPRVGGALTSQSDLPSTFTDAALTTTASMIYASILP